MTRVFTLFSSCFFVRVFLLISLIQLSFFVHAKVIDQKDLQKETNEWMASGAVRFTENKGQMVDMNGRSVPFVLFKTQAPGLNLYITEKGLTYCFIRFDEENEEKELKEGKPGWERRKEEEIKWARIDVELIGAHIKKENVTTEGRSSDFSQYFLAHCPDGVSDVRSYERVTIREIYPGIDWVFYNSSKKGIKYDFIVHPGADPSSIKLLYRSLEKLQVDDSGNVQIKTKYGNVTENAPASFLSGRFTKSSFRLISQEKNSLGGFDNLIGFDLPGISLPEQELRIDPQLVWATFYGGSTHADGPMHINTDNSNNVLVTGYTGSTDFPVQNGGGYFQGTHGGGAASAPWDAFVIKFSAAGVLQWATYYGGNLYDEAHAIVADASGNIFVTGLTESPNFPVQNAGTFFQGSNGGGYDAFILKFTAGGNLLWATYYGGGSSNNTDSGNGIDVDVSGNIFVAGAASPNFPTQNLAGAYNQAASGGGFGGDAFILKFTNTGNLLWGTYYGGNGNDKANAVAVDAAGNIFVGGMTAAANFPTQNSGTFFQAANGGGNFDAFLLKFNNAGARLWATYYGGSGDDEFWAVAVDGSNNLISAGSTSSANFPVQNSGTFFQGTFGGGWLDLVIAKFDNTGNRQWATYYGGTLNELVESAHNLAVDSCGSIYTGFYTDPNNTLVAQAPCDGGYYDNSFNGGQYDNYLLQFSNTGVLLWATYLGGNGYDFRSAMSVDNSGSLLVTGEWSNLSASGMNSGTYPLTNPGSGAYYSSYSGGSDDGFVVKFNKVPLVLTPAGINATCGCNGTASVTATGGCVPYSYSWSNGQTSQQASNLCGGTYTVTVADAACSIRTTTVVIASGGPGISGTASSLPATCNANGSAAVTPAGGSSPYTYLWSPSGGSGSAATGLGAGNYTVTITDGAGCVGTATVNVAAAGVPTVSVSAQGNVLCNGGTTGSAAVTASGGSSPYTYTWSNGASASSATGLAAGNYSVSVADANGCSQTQTLTITQPAAITASAVATAASCGVSNGTGSVNAAGGLPVYSYLWSSGGSSSAVSGLAAGNYSVLITDGNGCTATASVSVGSTGGPAVVIANQSTVSCNGGNNGTAAVSASGSTSPYTYVWNNGQSSSAASNLAAGNYTVTVTDAGGCTQTQTVSIAEPTAIAATTASTPAACGSTNGTASVNPVGGTPGYTYNWSNGGATAQVSNLAPQTYSVLITDSNGCTFSTSVAVPQSGGPTATAASNVTITQGSSTVLSASGGSAYSWTPITGLSCDSCQSTTASPMQTTQYCVFAYDTAGCFDSACVTVYVTVEPFDCSKATTEQIFLPNAFSPNGDGENETIGVLYPYMECIDELVIHIYNRWGELVFESDDPYFSWDGSYKGKSESAGVYVYMSKVQLINGEQIIKKGNISLIQ